MKTNTNETFSEQGRPASQLKISLLPIDEYAMRQGISRKIVEECGRLGVIQIRKHKGELYVVDAPIDSGLCHPEPTEAMSPEASEIINKLTATVDEITQSLPEPIDIPDFQVPEFADEPPWLIDEITEAEELEGTEETLDSKEKAKHNWQINAVLSIAFLFTSIFACLWVYTDRKIQLNKIEQANSSLQTANKSSFQATQQIETLQKSLAGSKTQTALLQNELKDYKGQTTWLQNELEDYKAQTGLLQNELKDYKTQAKTLKDELARINKSLETIRGRNAEAVKRLNKQIQKLYAQPPKQPR